MIKKMKHVISAVIAAGMLLWSILAPSTVYAASPVYSPGTMGGSYASGSTIYAASSASATTSHPKTSTKTAKVTGYYMLGVSITVHSSYEAASITDQPATASLSLPTGGVYYVGSKGEHYVAYSTMTWHDYSTLGFTY